MEVKGDAGQKGDTHCYCMSPITQIRETRVARGASPFITKVGVSPDEDFTPLDTNNNPPLNVQGPITRARAR
jgi:hypothetical protein